MTYTIDDFWIPRLANIRSDGLETTQPGWSAKSELNPLFVEADLILRDGFDNLNSSVWLIAAPGAVGKSTLAREMSARTGAIYLDLSLADTVAGNYLTGGLVKNNLYTEWQNQTSTIFIDALDEARIRVTLQSFADFLGDIAASAKNRDAPIVLLGRVGILEDSWLVLSDCGLECPIFDIDFFDVPRAVRFVMARLDHFSQQPSYTNLARNLLAHRKIYEEVVLGVVKKLERESASDGSRFFGYAPVLEAVATALSDVPNPAALDESLKSILGEQILRFLVDQILDRESKKLREQIKIAIPEHGDLFTQQEQLSRLAGVIYGVQSQLSLPKLQPHQVSAYDNAVQVLLPVHPFLDGSGQNPSGAVFGAAINAHALFDESPEMVQAAEQHANNGPNTPNPFLIDFYMDRAKHLSSGDPMVRPEHVVPLFESVCARAGAHDTVNLTIESDEGSEEAEVEIHIDSAGKEDHYILLRMPQEGVLRFGRQVSRVTVDAPNLDVVIGLGNPVELVAPVSISVSRITFDCTELVAQPEGGKRIEIDNTVFLESASSVVTNLASVPKVREGVDFLVSWPGMAVYPWVQFQAEASAEDGEEMHNALNRLSRLILAFRSHKQGRLARFKGKIEHVRITKGELGVRIRKQLMSDQIITYDDNRYFLDPSKLGEVVGATHQNLKLKRFNDNVRNYLRPILEVG